MDKMPYIIVGFLVVAGVISFIIINSNYFKLTDAERVSSLIALCACVGVLISATFVVSSYVHTNRAFMASQKPFLLLQVRSQHLQPNPQTPNTVPFTFIHYNNTSSNEFNDLTIYVKLKVSNREIDLSDVFKPKMFMAAHDLRDRRIETLSFLLQRGIDINKETNSGNEVLLLTGYSFTFNNKLEERTGPEYIWNSGIQHWELK